MIHVGRSIVVPQIVGKISYIVVTKAWKVMPLGARKVWMFLSQVANLLMIMICLILESFNRLCPLALPHPRILLANIVTVYGGGYKT